VVWWSVIISLFTVLLGGGEEYLQMYENYVDRCRRIGEEMDGAQNDVLLLENMCFNNQRDLKRLTNRKAVVV
jgi:hypothetical protein